MRGIFIGFQINYGVGSRPGRIRGLLEKYGYGQSYLGIRGPRNS
jgi:hypothetical protein